MRRAPTSLAATLAAPVSRLASVYPIVSARALARLFTYEIGDEVEKGAVLAIPFGNARRRGVVVDADAEAPAARAGGRSSHRNPAGQSDFHQ